MSALLSRSESGVRVAVVSGANRGIGLGVVEGLARSGFTTVLGTRDLDRGEAAAAPLLSQGLPVIVQQLDVTDQGSIDRLAEDLTARFGRLDVLVNNAAILYDTWQSAVAADLDTVRQAMETNVYGPWRMVQSLLPLLGASAHARIVNVSSEAGSLNGMGAGTPAYAVSKAALNALTRQLAAELQRSHILVNAVCPGWVATDMGGPGGRPIEAGAASVLWAVDLEDGGPSGGFFRDGRAVPW